MPRDSSGVFSLVAGNPVTPGTTIESDWANSTMQDLANALTDSLDRTGRGGMLAPMFFDDGSEAAPAISFTNEPTMGIYRPTSAKMVITVTAKDSVRFGVDGSIDWSVDAGATWINLQAELGKRPPTAESAELLTGADDLNTILVAGWYRWSEGTPPSNAPEDADALMHVDFSGEFPVQVVYSGSTAGDLSIFMSRANAGVYTTWTRIDGQAANDLRYAALAHEHLLTDITDSGAMAAEADVAEDGLTYARVDAAWAAVPRIASGTALPTDTTGYNEGDLFVVTET